MVQRRGLSRRSFLQSCSAFLATSALVTQWMGDGVAFASSPEGRASLSYGVALGLWYDLNALSGESRSSLRNHFNALLGPQFEQNPWVLFDLLLDSDEDSDDEQRLSSDYARKLWEKWIEDAEDADDGNADGALFKGLLRYLHLTNGANLSDRAFRGAFNASAEAIARTPAHRKRLLSFLSPHKATAFVTLQDARRDLMAYYDLQRYDAQKQAYLRWSRARYFADLFFVNPYYRKHYILPAVPMVPPSSKREVERLANIARVRLCDGQTRMKLVTDAFRLLADEMLYGDKEVEDILLNVPLSNSAFKARVYPGWVPPSERPSDDDSQDDASQE